RGTCDIPLAACGQTSSFVFESLFPKGTAQGRETALVRNSPSPPDFHCSARRSRRSSCLALLQWHGATASWRPFHPLGVMSHDKCYQTRFRVTIEPQFSRCPRHDTSNNRSREVHSQRGHAQPMGGGAGAQ